MTQSSMGYATMVFIAFTNQPILPNKEYAPMINYSDYQLPESPHPSHLSNPFQSFNDSLFLPHTLLPPSHPQDWLQEVDLTNRDHFPKCLDFAETLESDIRSVPQPLFSQESAGESSSQKPAEGRERTKNQTKNIPKNFGKGIISFIQRNQKKVRALLRQEKATYSCFIAMMREEKRRINTICDLRGLWTHQTYGRCLRIISNLFFRKHALHYIFNSRITNYTTHIKYRQALWKAVQNPNDFNRIKQF